MLMLSYWFDCAKIRILLVNSKNILLDYTINGEIEKNWNNSYKLNTFMKCFRNGFFISFLNKI